MPNSNDTEMTTTNFETSDIGLTVALFTYGYNVVDLKRENPTSKKLIFVFPQDDKIDAVVNDYWDSKLLLPAIKLISNHRVIKQRIYETLKTIENRD